MTAEELYEKEFGDADNIPKESVLRLLRHFAKALALEREQSLHIHNVVGQSEQLPKIKDGECCLCGDVAENGWVCEDCKKL